MDITAPCISSTVDEHGPITVYQTRTSLILSFDGQIYQSYMKLKDVHGLALGYTQAMMAGLLFIPHLQTATVMGLGGGSMVKCLLHRFPSVKVHAIESREEVVKVAKKYFHLPETDRLSIHIDDAEGYLKNTAAQSDIIFSDLYNAEGMEQLQVQSSYLRDCQKTLNRDGVLVLNICHAAPEMRAELGRLLALEFKNRLLSFEVDGGNTIVLAFKNEIPSLTSAELLARANRLEEEMNITMEPYAQQLSDALGR